MNSKKLVFTFAIALLGAITGVFTYSKFIKPEPQVITIESQSPVAKLASFDGIPSLSGFPDLTFAAEKSIHSVVHVKVKSMSKGYSGSGNPFFDFFFGPGYQPQPQQRMGFGSGVIISRDGYIVTNNHVIDGAEEIEVVLNDRRSFPAKLVGTDPSTDIALLKIDAKDLPYMVYGDSDVLKVGEWVIAVGNPFNLTSTVTAGIVSAKSRSINILANSGQQLGIEAFIQTDAAVNSGNSGGALVNTKGELIGINTAIASQTGTYAGYSFAVPVNIAKKVVGDLKEYGVVQRALLGVVITEVTKELAKEKGLETIEGIYVSQVNVNSGAKQAGIQAGDVILSVDGEWVNTIPELQEKISRHRPGDQVQIIVKRDGRRKPFAVTLRNSDGSTALLKPEDAGLLLGARIENLSDKDKTALQLRYGVRVISLQNGKLKNSGMRDGFIITKANQVPVTSVDDLRKVIASANEGLFLAGIYPNGRIEYYAINLEE
jgi:Do/DeqQ family serine protease